MLDLNEFRKEIETEDQWIKELAGSKEALIILHKEVALAHDAVKARGLPYACRILSGFMVRVTTEAIQKGTIDEDLYKIVEKDA